MLCQHFNSWRNKWWDEIVGKFTVELNAKLFSLDDIEMYEFIISGTFRLKHLTTSSRDQFLITNARNINVTFIIYYQLNMNIYYISNIS